MLRIKKIVISLIFLIVLIFLFAPPIIPENFQFQQLLNSASQEDVIIIFNSGGWGNTPLEEAKDFAPIIEGIQNTLNEWGYNSLVIPYARTKDNLFGKITGARDFLNSFKSSSEILAKKVEFLAKKFPDKKIILAGLSTGGAFVNKTIEKISIKTRDSVYGIVAGIPFWYRDSQSENILKLDNNGRDSLAVGNLKSLTFSLIKAPLRWILAKFDSQNLKFSQTGQIAVGHFYSWDSPEVGPQIVNFLEEKIK
ncbi:MAG: hypothetical protein QME61_01075 [Patescibacteria group bacterium]|nr:hypothetical protein [Patescibacteria group bacterium]